jgi:hypothetical protein
VGSVSPVKAIAHRHKALNRNNNREEGQGHHMCKVVLNEDYGKRPAMSLETTVLCSILTLLYLPTAS